MGVGLAVDYCSWAFPIQSSTTRHLRRHPPPPSLGLQEAFSHLMKVHTFSPILDGSISIKHQSTSSLLTCSYGEITSDKYSSVGKIASSEKVFSSPLLLRMSGNSDNEGFCTNTSCLPEDEFSQFRLLMENLGKIEDILSNSYLSKLERDILVHIGRLGALELFHSCLFKSFRDPCAPDSNLPLKKHLHDCPIGSPPERQTRDVIIHSTKKEYRKLKRKRRFEKTAEIPMVSSSANAATNFDEVPHLRTTRGSSLNSNRNQIARVESKLAMAVREVACLERICLKLEENGRPLTLAEHAKVAGIGKKVLFQRLHYGWLCRDRLLESTHSLVVFLSKSYSGRGIDFDDLVQAGNMGVLLGAERFDSTRGYRFSTYIKYWIKKYMSLVARYSREIRIPDRMEKIMRQIQKVKTSASFNEGIYLRDYDIAEITGLSLANITLAKMCYRHVNSIDQNLRGCLNIKLKEILPDTSIEAPEAATLRQHLRKDIDKLLESLHPREEQVLRLRFGFQDGRCRSLSEVGAIFHVSRQRISKIEKTALEKLRKEEIKAAMKHYLHPQFD